MVDDLKSLKDNLFKVLAGKSQFEDGDSDMSDEDEGEAGSMDYGAAKAILGTLFARAGKSKDDVVQILAREIGMAVAGMLRQPLSQLAKNQKLQITFEFVPKDGEEEESEKAPEPKARPKPSTPKSSTKPKAKK